MFVIEEKTNKSKADIRIVGVGGGGSNAVETMIKEGIKGVKFITINTDHQALESSSADVKIQLGSKLTKGLGAGANPEVGRRAAVESYEEIVKALEGADMVFITAGMGGGTGTGGSPLVAQAANELGILTVGIVTKPFVFEGRKRTKQAEQGIAELRNYVDTFIIIPNEKLLDISEKNISLLDAFKITDDVLLKAAKGITDLVSIPGLINLDFADIRTVMQNKGMSLMGRGVSEGKDRAVKAVCSAISSPLLDGVSIKGATGMIVNITANSSLSLAEVQSASSALTEAADDSADVIVGTVLDEGMGNKLSVTVIATGFKGGEPEKSDTSLLSLKKKLSLEEEAPAPSQMKEEESSKPLSFDESADFLEEESEKSNDTEVTSITQEASISSEEKSFFRDDSESKSQIEEPAEEEENPSAQESDSAESLDISTQDESVLELAPSTETKAEESSQSKKESGSSDKKLSPKEMLISKARAYNETQKTKNTSIDQDKQISMDWEETQIEESLSSPFESSLDFSNEDIV